MEMSVAFSVLQRRVADCPRSMVEGSAVKTPITGFAGGGGGGGASTFGGGGGGGGGAFFLQPAANSIRDNPNITAVVFRCLILNLCLLKS